MAYSKKLPKVMSSPGTHQVLRVAINLFIPKAASKEDSSQPGLTGQVIMREWDVCDCHTNQIHIQSKH